MIIPPGWNLPEPIRVRLGQNTFGRQRVIAEEGHLVIVLHKPPSADDTRREGVLFWRSPNGDWKWSRGMCGGPALTAHVQSYADLETTLTEDYDHAADLASFYNLLAALTPLTRSARNMHAALQAARETIKIDKLLLELRDRAYEIERNLELLLEDTKNAIQHRAAREAEEQSRLATESLASSHRLNVLAAIFLPLTAITSLFSMNIVTGLGQHDPMLFWIICLLSVGLGYALKTWVLAEVRIEVRPKKQAANSKG